MLLAYFLLGIIIVSAICVCASYLLFAGRLSPLSNIKNIFKYLVLTYAWLVVVILCTAILCFIGIGKSQSPMISKEKQRRIAHSGYYFSRDGKLSIFGKSSEATQISGQELENQENLQDLKTLGQLIQKHIPSAENKAQLDERIDEGFIHEALGPKEKIVLKPRWEGEKALNWDITYQTGDKPLRFENAVDGKVVSKCVNLSDERWLNSGDTVFFFLEKENETQFVTIKWAISTPGLFNKSANAFYWSQGVVGENGLDYTRSKDVLFSEANLQDGFRLENLIKRTKPNVRDQIGTIDNEWWNIFSGITLVRENRGDIHSRIGILIADELLQQSGLKIFKNYQNADSHQMVLINQEVATVIPSTTRIIYGLGYNNTLDMTLGNEIVNDDIWGQVMYVKFSFPQLWPLPPAPTDDFIITSTDDYMPLDGYLVDVGNSAHAFYAKAKLSENLDSISINDGKNIDSDNLSNEEAGKGDLPLRNFSLNKPASLGDFQQGVLITLLDTQGAVPYAGLMAIGLLILNGIAFTVSIRNYKANKLKLFLAWALMWNFLLTLLVVRLILTFRISLLPPLDATVREIENVFNKGVKWGVAGLAVCAVLAFVPSMVEWGQKNFRWKATGSKNHLLAKIILWGTLIVGWGILGKYFGSNQSILNLRINIAIHLILIIGLTLLIKRTLDAGKGIRAAMCLVIFVALAIQIGLIGDAGSIIYSLSLGVAVWLMLFWNETLVMPLKWKQVMRVCSSIAVCVAPLILILGLLYGPSRVIPYLTQYSFIRSAVRPAIPTTAFYRLTSFTDSEEDILTARSSESDTDLNILLDNSLQDWHMLLYASEGAFEPKGYGNAPLSKRGMTYPTSMADCVFSTYILAEHGWVASFLLLLIYLFLGLAGIIGGWFLPTDWGHRNIPLMAIGGFFICNAFYMAGANIGLTVFTGQNVPLLGLNSGSDLVQGIVLVGLAGFLLLGTSTDSSLKTMKSKHPKGFWIVATFCIGAFVWLAAIGIQMNLIGIDANYRGDHNFSETVFRDIKKHLPPDDDTPGKNRNPPWQLVTDRLEKKPGASVEEVENQYAHQFNERIDKYNPNGGLYYLENSVGLNGTIIKRVKVNDRYFLARSPFKEPAIWKGAILAAGDGQPTLSALGSTLSISLKETGNPETIRFSEPVPVITSSAILLEDNGNRFCELKRSGNTLRLDPKERSNKWNIYVDGRRITSVVDLEPLSIIAIEFTETKFRRNLIYLGVSPPTLAYVRWRNGEQKRLFPENTFPLSYFIGKSGDTTTRMEKNLSPSERKVKDDLQLSIDITLQQTLQREIANYAYKNAHYSPYQLQPKKLAVTVLDAFSGRTLAIPSWPALNPGKKDYENLIEKMPESVLTRFENNHNLTNHVAGSTFKPLVFTAMASALWSAPFKGAGGFDLSKITIFNNKDNYSNPDEPPVHPHLKIGNLKLDGMWDCNSEEAEADMSAFIIKSRDYPEGVIGMLGMMASNQDLGKVLISTQSRPDITYKGDGYIFDLTKASEGGTAFSIKDQLDGGYARPRGKEVLQNTLLFRELSSNFAFDYRVNDKEWLNSTCSTFIPMFDNNKVDVKKNDYLDNIVPEQMNLAKGDFQEVRGGIISCLLGGGDCGFNNVQMAEAGARLASGQRVLAHIEDYSIGPATQMPLPLSDIHWRYSNIIDPMQKAGEEGTAEILRSMVSLPPDYKAIYKTGTLIEGKENRESETLLFVIGKWRDNAFVPGQTIAGYLYMEKSKDKDIKEKKKFAFASPILNELVKYLQNKT